MHWKDLPELIKETVSGWTRKKTYMLGAALAYFGVFALAPTLVIAMAVTALLFGAEAARGELVEQLEQAVGPSVARAMVEALARVHFNESSTTAMVVGIAVLIFGATGFFIQLQTALNTVWGVERKPGRGLWFAVRSRFLAFVLVLVMGGLLLVSLVASTVLSGLHGLLPADSLPGALYFWEVLNWVLTLGLMTVLFALTYKLLPDVHITWGDVWAGAFITALLFALGNFGIALYLGRSAATSAYGAAGSLVMVMLWIYYSSQVLLFGAEFTQKFANKYGEPMRPADYATYLSAEGWRHPAEADRREAKGSQPVTAQPS